MGGWGWKSLLQVSVAFCFVVKQIDNLIVKL